MFFAKRIEALSTRIALANAAAFLLTMVLTYWVLGLLLGRYLAREVDRDLKSDLLDLSLVLAGGDHEAITRELARFGYGAGTAKAFARVSDARGEVIATSDMRAWPELRAVPPVITDALFTWETRRAEAHPDGVRVLTFRTEDEMRLEIGVDLGDSRRLLGRVRLALAGVLGLALMIATGLVWAATRRSLTVIDEVSETARRITEELDFSRRVPEGARGTRETARLAAAFDTLVDKISVLVRGQRHVMDAIAHDIRSPVARMRAAAETRLSTEDDAIAAKVVEQCDYILSLVNMLLDISAAETKTGHFQREIVDLTRLVSEAVELFEAVAEDGNRQLELVAAPDIEVESDRRTLQRVIANLLDNALKYTRAGEHVRVTLMSTIDGVSLVVADNGPGIPAESLPRVFERFYRGETSRSTPGSGLGLAFCKAAVEAMDGSLRCESVEGEGTRFILELPRVSRVAILP